MPGAPIESNIMSFSVKVVKIDLDYSFEKEKGEQEASALLAQGYKVQESHVTQTERGLPAHMILLLVRNPNLAPFSNT